MVIRERFSYSGIRDVLGGLLEQDLHTKGLPRNNRVGAVVVERYGMVPRGVELLASDIDRLDLFVSALHAFRLEIAIDLAAYGEASFGRRHPMSLRSSRRYDSFVSRRILRLVCP